jgi:exonuclease VII small subunit
MRGTWMPPDLCQQIKKSRLTTRFQRARLAMNQEITEAKSELEAAQSALDAALRTWDESVSELWRTSLALTQAQKRVTRAYELLRDALAETNLSGMDV